MDEDLREELMEEERIAEVCECCECDEEESVTFAVERDEYAFETTSEYGRTKSIWVPFVEEFPVGSRWKKNSSGNVYEVLGYQRNRIVYRSANDEHARKWKLYSMRFASRFHRVVE